MLAHGLLLVFLFTAVATDSPELLFREDWAESPAEIPINQRHVVNPDLVVKLYGPGAMGIKKSHHDHIQNDPYYVWSGACPGNWALTLRHKKGPMDLEGGARIRWRSRQSGFHRLRPILKLTDGRWLVGDVFDPESPNWQIVEFKLSDIRWRELDIVRITGKKWLDSPSLGSVEEVGFTDLMPGGSSDASSRVDWIEVYGRLAH